MSKLDSLLQRARSLSFERQVELADLIDLWLSEPDWPEPSDEAKDVGGPDELERRVAAWNANPKGVSAADLHARLKSRRETM